MSCPVASPDTKQSDKSYNAAANKAKTYGEYLQLDKLLSSQGMKSKAHDEHMFIIIHQVYELWFKQIIFEIDSVRGVFEESFVDEREMFVVTSRLKRVVQILKLLVDQIGVIETMSPMDFVEFRNMLGSASGFQSYQFRVLENKLGLPQANRQKYSQKDYKTVLESETDNMSTVVKSETETSLSELLQRWLERTPGIEKDGFNFWSKFSDKVNEMLQKQYNSNQDDLDQSAKDNLKIQYQKQRETFDSIFNEDKHKELRSKGDRRFTHKAFQGAMMIFFYRDEPRFNLPYQMLQLLMDIDALVMKWRYTHVLMVHRMLGSKPGTGGSSGVDYLKSTVTDRYKVFLDLFNLSTFLIPRSELPVLDLQMMKQLSKPSSSAEIAE
ncbi:tryptophan 2,3-dioxygenase-like [Saccoglossus kowalevskii]|uniref:Tryptophan 2,3-dioxygenase n=1 Tax=Saccoglossus kowalevskii TaxID=10224 RepID=A0ABM0GLB3_SACKO|nr:PREDICTED: tryptophan 2,3-dioxygenase-like [Saccoglossus kowalevskii]